MKTIIYNRLKKIYYWIFRLLPYLYFRFTMRGCKIGSNISVGRHCFFRGKRRTAIGNNIRFGDNCLIEVGGINPDAKLIIGNDFSATSNLFISCNYSITIGNRALFGNNIRIYDSNHGIDPECGIPYEHQKLVCKPVVIGSNTWIGDNCIILAGTSIGEYSVIGAGSVVTGKIPEYTIAAGVPARVIKKWDTNNKTWIKL